VAYGSGISAQIAYGEEATWGTRQAPDHYIEFLNEGFGLSIARIDSKALRAGTRVARSDRWVSGAHSVQWKLSVQAQTRSLGLILKHLLGAVSTTTPGGGTNSRTHKFTLGDLTGKGLTVQVGRPSTDETVRPFDYTGCKVTDATFKYAVDSPVEIDFSGVGKDEDTSQTLAVATYATPLEVLSWQNATFTVGGSAYAAQQADFTVAHKFDTSRVNMGATTIKEPIVNDLSDLTGTFSSEFIDLTGYTRFVNGTTGALVMDALSVNYLEGTIKGELKITLPYVRFDGDTANVGGPGILTQPIKWTALDDGSTDAPVKIEYTTLDLTP
jgi:hypothetical protein